MQIFITNKSMVKNYKVVFILKNYTALQLFLLSELNNLENN
jgi:hypothetical protein